MLGGGGELVGGGGEPGIASRGRWAGEEGMVSRWEGLVEDRLSGRLGTGGGASSPSLLDGLEDCSPSPVRERDRPDFTGIAGGARS